ncbi:MAG: sialidase family protein [Minicystis sp.]
MKPRPLAAILVILAACSSERPFYPPPPGVTDTGTTTAGTGGAGGSGPITAGPVISIAPIANWEAETHLARASDGRVFAVWIALQLGSGRLIDYAISPDDGATWSQPGVVPSDPDAEAVDPSVTVDAAGVFHVAWLEIPAAGARRVKTAEYLDPGDVFSIPVEVTDPASPADWDKPWILALDEGGLFLIWGRETGNTLVAATSPDGATWQRTPIAPDGTLRNVAIPCSAGKGRLHVTNLVPGGVELSRSDDGGATWSKPVRVDPPGQPAAFEQPSCVASGDEVWVLYGTSPDPDDAKHTPLLQTLVIAHSTDGGATFADRHTFGGATGPRALVPFLSRAPGGRLDVIGYYGAKAGDAQAAVRWFRSPDGVTWGDVRTVHAPVLLETARDGFGWLGDYVGVWSEDDAVYVTFADNLAGAGELSHVRFGRVAAP